MLAADSRFARRRREDEEDDDDDDPCLPSSAQTGSVVMRTDAVTEIPLRFYSCHLRLAS
jgi:hypothetical protein